eukprot:881740-Pleurochrysis_carterae.AAC.1
MAAREQFRDSTALAWATCFGRLANISRFRSEPSKSDSQNLRHCAKANYSPLSAPGRLATGCHHLYIIIHPYTNILPNPGLLTDSGEPPLQT